MPTLSSKFDPWSTLPQLASHAKKKNSSRDARILNDGHGKENCRPPLQNGIKRLDK